MKKLLLLSLIVAGANAFGASIGSTETASLPIKTMANVVAATGKEIIISATTDGMNGDTMEFDFGTIQANKPYRHSLQGTFTVKLADESAFSGFGNTSGAADLDVAFDSNMSQKTVKTTGDSSKLVSGMDVTYSMTGSLNETKKVYNGEITAIMNVESGVAAGAYVDTTQRIYAKVSNNA